MKQLQKCHYNFESAYYSEPCFRLLIRPAEQLRLNLTYWDDYAVLVLCSTAFVTDFHKS